MPVEYYCNSADSFDSAFYQGGNDHCDIVFGLGVCEWLKWFLAMPESPPDSGYQSTESSCTIPLWRKIE